MITLVREIYKGVGGNGQYEFKGTFTISSWINFHPILKTCLDLGDSGLFYINRITQKQKENNDNPDLVFYNRIEIENYKWNQEFPELRDKLLDLNWEWTPKY